MPSLNKVVLPMALFLIRSLASVTALADTNAAFNESCDATKVTDLNTTPDPAPLIQRRSSKLPINTLLAEDGKALAFLFLIRTGGPDSTNRRAAIRSTWGSDLTEGSNGTVVFLKSVPECEKMFGDNHGEGLTCLEARNEWSLRNRTDYDWLAVIDDDVYVHLANLRSSFENKDRNEKVVWGIPGCGHCGHGRSGLCGGGGYVVSRQSFQVMMTELGNQDSEGAADPKIKANPRSFLEQFIAQPDQDWCDVRFGCVAQMHGLEMRLLDGLYGWPLDEIQQEKAIRSSEVPPLTIHYSDPKRMQQLHAAFSHVSLAHMHSSKGGMSLSAYRDQVRRYVQANRRGGSS